jgi:DNA-binding SARP family transcriptional activator
MVTLNRKETKRFLKRIKEDLEHPLGPVPTPKLKKAIKMIKKDMEKKMKKLKQKLPLKGV